MKKNIIVAIIVGLCVWFGVKHFKKSDSSQPQNMKATLHIGVTEGPHAKIMEVVQQQAEKEGLFIKLVKFNDFILPNSALDQKEIDVNSYQHLPFLNEQIKSRGYRLKAILPTILMPLGVYSKKIDHISKLKEGAKVFIPNDPTNGGRALKLLEKLELIKLKDIELPSLLDVVENPKKLSIKEIEAPSLPRLLEDADIALINTDWVLISGLDPQKALALESKESPYANMLVIREEDEHREEIQKLIRLYQSDMVKKFIETEFKGAVIATW